MGANGKNICHADIKLSWLYGWILHKSDPMFSVCGLVFHNSGLKYSQKISRVFEIYILIWLGFIDASG